MDPLAREQSSHADALAHRLARVGVELGREREGVVALARYVAGNRELWGAADRERLAIEIAAFVGDCVIATYGLAWHRAADGTAVIELPTGEVLAPLSWARALVQGTGDEPVAWFDRVGTELARGGA